MLTNVLHASKLDVLAPDVLRREYSSPRHITRLAAIATQPVVQILLCTLNGELYLKELLASLIGQTHFSWRLVVSDDGSRDGTRAILSEFARSGAAPIKVMQGPGRGAAANFLSLAIDPNIRGDYFAFCDQDDIWDHDKLKRAVAWLKTVPEDAPALYTARRRHIDAAGRPLGLAPLFDKTPSFRNALTQNIAGGNTIVLNRAAKRLLEAAGRIDAAHHDWWCYTLVSGAEGRVHYDVRPCLSYRQHDRNAVGGMITWRCRWAHTKWILTGGLAEMNKAKLAALYDVAHLLSAENKRRLGHFGKLRSESLLVRLLAFLRLRPYRQSWRGNLALFLAIFFKKI